MGFLASGRGGGSGFFVRPDLVATNFHVVEANQNYLAVWVDGADGKPVRQNAQVAAVDKVNDLALVRLAANATIKGSPLALTADEPSPKQPVAIMGHPALMSTRYSAGEFIQVARNVTVTGYGVFPELYNISAAAISGNSGSPLLDGYGQVIGVVDAASTTNQNNALAIPVSALQNLLARVP